jgi:hypothetical protein
MGLGPVKLPTISPFGAILFCDGVARSPDIVDGLFSILAVFKLFDTAMRACNVHCW